MQETDVREVVMFSLVEGTNPQRFVETVAGVTGWLAARPGFVGRELAHDAEQDRWVDLVTWRSVEDAVAAADAAMQAPECGPMFELIEPTSITVLHASPVQVPIGA